jgi:hypothetical protein
MKRRRHVYPELMEFERIHPEQFVPTTAVAAR